MLLDRLGVPLVFSFILLLVIFFILFGYLISGALITGLNQIGYHI